MMLEQFIGKYLDDNESVFSRWLKKVMVFDILNFTEETFGSLWEENWRTYNNKIKKYFDFLHLFHFDIPNQRSTYNSTKNVKIKFKFEKNLQKLSIQTTKLQLNKKSKKTDLIWLKIM